MGASAWPRSAALRLALFLGLLASAACTPLELKTKIPIPLNSITSTISTKRVTLKEKFRIL